MVSPNSGSDCGSRLLHRHRKSWATQAILEAALRCRPLGAPLAALLLCCTAAATGPAAAAEPTACPAPALAHLQRDNAAAAAYFTAQIGDAAAAGKAVDRAPPDAVLAERHGARGNGVADDTPALQAALAQGRPVWLASGKVYRITRRLDLGDGAGLLSDGTATLLLAAGAEGFANTTALRSDDALYGPRGTGLRVSGRQVVLQDFFIVKDYEDERYVIGIDVRAASQVQLRRLKLRGFSLAPGIVTVRSSNDVEIRGLLIHDACTASTRVPPDLPSFQITGISIDDTRVGGLGSRRLTLAGNVIANLRMLPLTPRGDQSDGINFAAIGTGQDSLISGNRISGVDEGLDLWGDGITVLGNRVAAHSLALKLIHGAQQIVVRNNELQPGPGGRGVGIFSARPAEAQRQVHDVLIEHNRIGAGPVRRVAVHVDDSGEFPPLRVSLRHNRFDTPDCKHAALRCAAPACAAADNTQQTQSGAACGRP
ncbi:hypothetical protein [Aquabacterium sp.]|uniref:hypothetical protein n=1 Tax=Aquabacterium sp. TaxID=1872578 RepID=UPI002C5E30BB|nr:hypothetical protein [Aquabacterium sp.]HSW07414.1 hypothetical protein [Aquabacterium sp.]